MSDELRRLQEQVHQDITIFDFDGKKIPCIIVEAKKYDQMLSKVAGQPLSINTDLNIMQDGLGNAFVEIVFTFSKVDITEKFLIDAKDALAFFESLAETSMLGGADPSRTVPPYCGKFRCKGGRSHS